MIIPKNQLKINSNRDAGVKAIESLMKKKGKFDYILLETTGLADPAPIASMFWLDDDVQSDIYLDGKLVKKRPEIAHNQHTHKICRYYYNGGRQIRTAAFE